MLNTNTSRNWLLKYKLYHVPFWCLYHYLWWVVAIGNPVKAANSIILFPFYIKFAFYVIFQAAAVYFNLYYLIPKYLEKGRYTAYITLLVLTIAATACAIVGGYYLCSAVSGKSFEVLFGPGDYCFLHFFGNALPSTLASMTLAMSIKLTKSWLQTKRRQQLLETEKLETELNFLKNQFNPHFLFNTINSIFFLIHKNPDVASASLAKFSELLRYQLYECNDKQIALSKEIGYLENSIELEKLRLNNNVEVSFTYHRQPVSHLSIAPFILMTFVENAFKHVSKHADGPNWIRIQLYLDGPQLAFTVSNSCAADEYSAPIIDYGGIGLKNVQRRLDLVYPGQYELDILRETGSFEIRLQLELAELTVPQLLST
ncbi:two-component system LytT family sensor kinase [Chitinophaga sp. W2I13]|uniref:sensor histidine kinase n=1 Tax=Chitinophaga sp. W2I13 TaxID=3373923 RepID=UPI003D1C7451